MRGKPVDKEKVKKVVEKVKKSKKSAPAAVAEAEKKQPRLSTGQIRKRLDLQWNLDKVLLEQAQHALPSLDVMRDVEHARARLKLCESLLNEFWWHRGDKK